MDPYELYPNDKLSLKKCTDNRKISIKSLQRIIESKIRDLHPDKLNENIFRVLEDILDEAKEVSNELSG